MNIKKCNSHPKIKTRRPGKRIQRTQKSRRILVRTQNLTNPKWLKHLKHGGISLFLKRGKDCNPLSKLSTIMLSKRWHPNWPKTRNRMKYLARSGEKWPTRFTSNDELIKILYSIIVIYSGAFVSPLVLLPNLSLFLRSEVIGDAESLPDFLGSFAWISFMVPLMRVATLAQHNSMSDRTSR